MKIRLKHERLQAEIAGSRLSQNRWALRLGLSSGQLSEMVNGKRPYPSPETRRKLLEKLSLPFEELFEVEIEESKPPCKRFVPLIEIERGHYRLKLERVHRGTIRSRKEDRMRGIGQDLRVSWRSLAHNPGFAAVVVLTLALAIGANTAAFSVVHSVLIQPLAYADADRLFAPAIFPQQGGRQTSHSIADFRGWEAAAESFESAAAATWPQWTGLSGLDSPQRVRTSFVSAGFFSTLGVEAAQGRTFEAGEDLPSSPRLAVISHGFQQRRLKGDPRPIGRSVLLDGESYEIIGVMPAGFRDVFEDVEIWPAFRFSQPQARRPFILRGFVRLREGLTPSAAEAELDAVASRVKRSYPNSPGDWRYGLVPLKEYVVADSRQALWVLWGAVSCVLLVACVNIASLFLARASIREKDMAVRASLGASRWRMLRLSLAEGVILAAAGGALGMVLAHWGVSLLVQAQPDGWARLSDVRVDGYSLAFCLATSLSAALVFGLAPGLQLSAKSLGNRLRESGRSGLSGLRQSKARSVLVVAEVALALALLVGAGLMIRSFSQLMSVDPGFEPRWVQSMLVSIPQARYPEIQEYRSFYTGLLKRVRAMAGVESAGIGTSLPPVRDSAQNPFTAEGRLQPAGKSSPLASQLLVDPGFFETMGIPLVQGRLFDARDRIGAPETAIVNRTLAEASFPGQEAVGKRLMLGDPNPGNHWVTIVGVVGDVKFRGLDDPPVATVYRSMEQETWRLPFYLVMRSRMPTSSTAAGLKRELAAIDPAVPMGALRPMDEVIRDSLGEERTRTFILSTLAAAALLLSSLGVYGVMSQAVQQRTREAGIRIALGAEGAQVMALMLRQGMRWALLGLLIGAVCALAFSRVLSGLLYAISPADPLVYAAAAALLAAAALAACYFPSRRATRVDPVQALRGE